MNRRLIIIQDYSDRFTILPVDMSKLVKDLNDRLMKKCLVITGECTAVFDGRIKSRLEIGERLLIIKKDLSIILHESTGMRPVQWQLPRAGSVTFIHDDGDDYLRPDPVARSGAGDAGPRAARPGAHVLLRAQERGLPAPPADELLR